VFHIVLYVGVSMHAERDIVMANLSVRLSVCLSHFGIVAKRMHISSNSFDHLVQGINSLSSATAVTKLQGEFPQWGR